MGHCTGWFDGILWWDWGQCCAVHDTDYEIGVVKIIADYFLRVCVNQSLPGMGDLMYWGLTWLFVGISAFLYERAAQKRREKQGAA